MAEKPKQEGEGEAAAAPKKGGKKIIVIVIALVVLVAGIGVPMVLMKGGEKPKDGEHAEEHEEETPPRLEVTDLGTFVVNLSEASSFLKVNIKLEYDAGLLDKLLHAGGEGHGEESGDAGSGGGGEGGGAGALHPHLKAREANIRDAIIRVLSSKKVVEVLTPDGKEQLKEELLEAINDATGLEQPVATGIFFTDFIVQ